jgi:hypothetical protein
MKVIFGSVLIALLIGVVAALVLNAAQRPAYEAFSTSSTRVGEPGHNLVGDNWSGNPGRPGNS